MCSRRISHQLISPCDVESRPLLLFARTSLGRWLLYVVDASFFFTLDQSSNISSTSISRHFFCLSLYIVNLFTTQPLKQIRSTTSVSSSTKRMWLLAPSWRRRQDGKRSRGSKVSWLCLYLLAWSICLERMAKARNEQRKGFNLANLWCSQAMVKGIIGAKRERERSGRH